ncbi:MAG: choice-of-anchor A family protein, partial [Firmicutes bacterium]|nr:choice-of-anchor A family protein [Bacillota bacterium]
MSTSNTLSGKFKQVLSKVLIVSGALLAMLSSFSFAFMVSANAGAAPAVAAEPGNNPFLFNEFIDTNSYRENVDSRGAAAVGGNLTITGSFTVADAPGITYTCSDDTLVVGGNIASAGASAELSIGMGTALYSGTVSGVSIYSNAAPTCNPASVQGATSFNSGWQTAVNDSTTWAGETANGTVSTAGGTTTLTGTSSGVNYFSVSPSQLLGTVNIVVPAGATSIINVSGTSYTNNVNTIDFNGSSGTTPEEEHTLWNFSTATSLTFANGVQWGGALLAPKGVVQFNNGKVLGNLIAYQLGTATNPANVETHERYFVPPPHSPPPTTTTTVPPTTSTTTTTVPPTTSTTTTTVPPTTSTTTTTVPPTTSTTTTTVPPTTSTTTTTVPPTTSTTTTTVPPTTSTTTTTVPPTTSTTTTTVPPT